MRKLFFILFFLIGLSAHAQIIINSYSHAVSYSPEYRAVLAYAVANGAVAPAAAVDKASENKFINQTIALGAWTQADQIFFLGATNGDGPYSLINIKSPGTDNGSTVGTITFTAKSGWQSASNGYINSNFEPSTGTNFTLNDAGFIFYTPTAAAGSATAVEVGGSDASGNNAVNASVRTNTNVAAFRINQNANSSITNTISNGVYQFRRTSSTLNRLYKDQLFVNSSSVASSSRTTRPLYLLANNNNGTAANFSTKVGAFWMAGASWQNFEFNLASYINDLYSLQHEISFVPFSNWQDFTTDLAPYLASLSNLPATFSYTGVVNQQTLVGAAFSGSVNAWQGACMAENDIGYAAPSTNTTILAINTITDTYTEIATPCSAGAAKYGGNVYAITKKIYFCPQNATAVMVYNTETGQVYFFDTTGIVSDDTDGNLSGSVKWYGIYQGADGRLYCIPFNATEVMIIDPSDDSIEFIDTTGPVVFGAGNLTGLAKWDGGCNYGNTLLGSPSDAVDFLKINTLAGTCQRLGSVPAGTNKHAIATVSKEGFGYIFPYFDNRIIKYNFSNDTYAYLAATIGSIDANIKVGNANVMPDGRILITSVQPTNSFTLDTGTDVLTTVGVNLNTGIGSGNKCIGGFVAKNGAQYNVPFGLPAVLKQFYNGTWCNMSTNFVLSRIGKY